MDLTSKTASALTPWLHTALHSLPPPTDAQGVELESVEVYIKGRAITLGGLTEPVVAFPNSNFKYQSLDPAWRDRATGLLTRLVAHPDVLLPERAVRSALFHQEGRETIKPTLLYSQTFFLRHAQMSSHERLQAASSLPAGVLDRD